MKEYRQPSATMKQVATRSIIISIKVQENHAKQDFFGARLKILSTQSGQFCKVSEFLFISAGSLEETSV